MERADIAKLWHLEEIAAAGHHELAANLRTAINELVIARGRVAVLEEECRACRNFYDATFPVTLDQIERIDRARRAVDENGGV